VSQNKYHPFVLAITSSDAIQLGYFLAEMYLR